MWSKLLDLIPGVGQIKLSMTTVLYLLAGLAVAGLIGYGLYEAHEIKALEEDAGKATQQIKDLGAANKELAGQLKLAQASAKINTDVTTADVQDKQAAQTSSANIATTAQQQITTIVKKYQPQGPTQVLPPVQAKQEADEISGVRLDSMWKTYCQSMPDDTKGCVMVIPSGPKATTLPKAPNSHPAAQVGPTA